MEAEREIRWPALQVAFDQTNLEEALRIAEKVVKAGNLWLEVGTPLIKAEGMRAVAEFRKRFPDYVIVADMKTFDAGWVEAELAVKAGANVVSVLGAADEETVIDVIETCRKLGAKSLVDLMGVNDPIEKAARAEKLGADIVLIHVGFGKQKRGKTALTALNLVEKIAKSIKIPVAAAGGIKPGSARKFVDAGCKIVIVGSAITKAEDPEAAAKAILEEIGSK